MILTCDCISSNEYGRHDIVEKSLGEMEEELEKMTNEKEEMAKEAISLTAVLESAKKECFALTKQLEEDQLTYDRESTNLRQSVRETMENELQRERETFDSSIATLVKERKELSAQLEELTRKGDINGRLLEELQSQKDTSAQKVSELSIIVRS